MYFLPTNTHANTTTPHTHTHIHTHTRTHSFAHTHVQTFEKTFRHTNINVENVLLFENTEKTHLHLGSMHLHLRYLRLHFSSLRTCCNMPLFLQFETPREIICMTYPQQVIQLCIQLLQTCTEFSGCCNADQKHRRIENKLKEPLALQLASA